VGICPEEGICPECMKSHICFVTTTRRLVKRFGPVVHETQGCFDFFSRYNVCNSMSVMGRCLHIIQVQEIFARNDVYINIGMPVYSTIFEKVAGGTLCTQ